MRMSQQGQVVLKGRYKCLKGLSSVEENDVRYAALPDLKILARLHGLCMLGRQQSGPLQIPTLSPLHSDFHLIRLCSHLISSSSVLPRIVLQFL
jgi:hypothetical protein